MLKAVLIVIEESTVAFAYASPEIRIPRSEAIYRELNDCSVDLKRILGRIPEQIYDRKQFLETIK